MLDIIKNLFMERHRTHGGSDELSVLQQYCGRWLDAGCSPSAADIIIKNYRDGRITLQEALGYAQDLQYCSDIREIRRRFSVDFPPGRKDPVRTDPLDAVYGAMYGDIIGSKYEGNNITDISSVVRDPFQPGCRLTDDSVLTVATFMAETRDRDISYCDTPVKLDDIREDSPYPVLYNPYAPAYKKMARRFPYAGYGSSFITWMDSDDTGLLPYGSLGNGSAMRVSPVGTMNSDPGTVIERAAVSAMATHNHIEGVKGAVVTAVCIWMARNGYSKAQIFGYMKKHFSYGQSADIFNDFTYREATEKRVNQVQCSYSVPAAVISFYESRDYMDAIRLSACVGYDNDTNACICGGIAGAYYGIPDSVRDVVTKKLKELYGHDPLKRAARQDEKEGCCL